ncbi:lipid A deacylase LpxR family protein [Fulvivirga sp.]|uniref:lipid A deacylase LpxR family protein n=1 Tax=Fulvivirga sp. TaxID=1931237 RepID=UPI0032EFF21E
MKIPAFLFFLLPISCFAQEVFNSHRMDRELTVRYDNDVVFVIDQYYTSGADISYARVVSEEKLLGRLFKTSYEQSKVLMRIDYGHKIFTPQKIREPDVARRDRPFAGWHYTGLWIDNYPSKNASNQYGVRLGMVGPSSGIGNFQLWWHDVASITAPKGWEYEIQDEFVVNLNYLRTQRIPIAKSFDLVSETQLTAGNGNTRAYQQLTMRLGELNPLDNSGYNRSRLSKSIPEIGTIDQFLEEGFFFYGLRAEYVNHNIFIEGSRIGSSSPHEERAEDFMITHVWGGVYSSHYTTFRVLFYRMSPEVVGGKVHRFISLELGFRF